MGNLIQKAKSISYNDVLQNDFSLSVLDYKKFDFPNKNKLYLKDICKIEQGTFVENIDRTNIKTELNYITIRDFDGYILSKTFKNYIIPKYPFTSFKIEKNTILVSDAGSIGKSTFVDFEMKGINADGITRLNSLENERINIYYIYGCLQHSYFPELLKTIAPSGSTQQNVEIKHFMEAFIPYPTSNEKEIVNFVSLLTQAIINKEKLIKERHEAILKAIETELLENQKPKGFSFELPRINELEEVGRIDTARYSYEYKKYEHLIQNYKNGFFKLSELGYTVNRGQNLQVSNIGESFYSNHYIKGFYKLAVSSNFSEYSTVEKFNYLGNPGSLSKIKKGEIIFSARGAQFGRVVTFPEDIENTISNIDSLVIKNEDVNIERNIFIAMFLNNLRWNKHIYKIAITGSGANSLTQYQSDDINFPNFEEAKQKEIAKHYHNSEVEYNAETFTLANFLEKDNEYNQQAGIYELDKTAKQLKEILNQTIDDIVNDREVIINFII